MTAKLDTKLLEEVQKLVNEKVAFVPMPGGDPGMGGGMPPPGAPPMDPAAMGGGMPPPGDPAAMGAPPMDPAMAGGMPPPADPMAAGAPPPPAPAPAPSSGMINMTSDEFLKFVKQIVALCTSGKFGNEQPPTDGGPVPDGLAAMNAKIDAILQATQG